VINSVFESDKASWVCVCAVEVGGFVTTSSIVRLSPATLGKAFYTLYIVVLELLYAFSKLL
jgi:hypothetical protein